MSEAQMGGYDWSKETLLDACYDPMLPGIAHDWYLDIAPIPMENEPPNVKQGSQPITSISIASSIDQTCAECGEEFIYLDSHAKWIRHRSFPCLSPGCEEAFTSLPERDAHQRTPHILGHKQIQTIKPFDCLECRATFYSKADLLRHAKLDQHQPYGCECGSLFSRIDVLNRHLRSLSTDEPQFPCKYCRRHRGPNGFKRRDHLLQHVRNYHHHEQDTANDTDLSASASSTSRLKYYFPICSHADCPQYRDDSFPKLPRSAQESDKPFTSRSAYTKHMREEHNECTFPCDVVGCERVGRKGYFREKDLLKHRREHHPNANQYQVAKRQLRIMCTDGCGASLDPSSMTYHPCKKPTAADFPYGLYGHVPPPIVDTEHSSVPSIGTSLTLNNYEDFDFTSELGDHMDFSF